MPKVVATIEARMTSTRLPGKVMLPAAGKPLLEHMIERLRRVPSLDEVVIATTTKATDDVLVTLAERLGVGSFRGSEDDVLSRVLGAAQAYKADAIVQLTGDCPAIDPNIVETCVQEYFSTGVDFVSNVLQPSYPWGMDTKVFSMRVLAEVAQLTQDPADREHVSLYIYEHPERYRLHNVTAPPELTWREMHIELDTQEDYELLKAIFGSLYPQNPAFTLGDMIAFLKAHPEIAGLNEAIKRRGAR